MAENQEVFTQIYKNKKWGKDGAGSGRGSTIENAQRTCEVIRQIFRSYKLHGLLDAPCGALEWTEPFLLGMREEDPLFRYHGVDVVAHVVEQNRQRLLYDYCGFSTVDLAVQAPPSGFDLILCRDALQHLSFRGIAGVLNSFARCDAPYLLVTSYKPAHSPWWRVHKRKDNRDIDTGGFFRNDLLSAPFSMSEGLLETFDDARPTGLATGHLLLFYDLRSLSASRAFKSFIERYR